MYKPRHHRIFSLLTTKYFDRMGIAKSVKNQKPLKKIEKSIELFLFLENSCIFAIA